MKLINYTRKDINTQKIIIFAPERVYFSPDIDMKLSEFVKQRRNNAKLTQPELAAKAGVGLRFLRDLEQGKPTLRIDKVNQVLQLFGHELEPVESRKRPD